jgi:hypothetical protein
MKTNNQQADIHRLLDIVVEEVSLVDRAANKQRFLIVKRSDEMNDTTEQNSDATAAKEDGVESSDTINTSASNAANDSVAPTHAANDVSSGDDVALQHVAVSALASLTEAVELLGTAGDESTRSRVAELAGELRTVANQLTGASDNEESSDTASESKIKPKNEDIESLIESVKTALQRVSGLLSDNGNDGQPERTSQANSLATVIEEMRALTSTVKEQQQRLSKLEKRSGMPSSVPAGEGQSRSETEEVGWPLDLNRSYDRESVDKSVSFHDV